MAPRPRAHPVRHRNDCSAAVVRRLLGSRKPFHVPPRSHPRPRRVRDARGGCGLGVGARLRAERRSAPGGTRAPARAARQGQRRDRRAQACGWWRPRRLPAAGPPRRRGVAGAAADGDRGAPGYPRRRHRQESTTADRGADRRPGRPRRQGRYPRRSVAPGSGASGRAGAPRYRHPGTTRAAQARRRPRSRSDSRRWKVRSAGSRAVPAPPSARTTSTAGTRAASRSDTTTPGGPAGRSRPGSLRRASTPTTNRQRHREGERAAVRAASRAARYRRRSATSGISRRAASPPRRHRRWSARPPPCAPARTGWTRRPGRCAPARTRSNEPRRTRLDCGPNAGAALRASIDRDSARRHVVRSRRRPGARAGNRRRHRRHRALPVARRGRRRIRQQRAPRRAALQRRRRLGRVLPAAVRGHRPTTRSWSLPVTRSRCPATAAGKMFDAAGARSENVAHRTVVTVVAAALGAASG